MTHEPNDKDEAIFTPPKFDANEYRDGLSEFNLTQEQETELLQTLWNIMSMMVDLGWGLDSVQLFAPSPTDKIDSDSTDPVKQKNTVKHFNKTVHFKTEKGKPHAK